MPLVERALAVIEGTGFPAFARHMDWDVGLRLLSNDVQHTWVRRLAIMSLSRMGDEWLCLSLFQMCEALRHEPNTLKPPGGGKGSSASDTKGGTHAADRRRMKGRTKSLGGDSSMWAEGGGLKELGRKHASSGDMGKERLAMVSLSRLASAESDFSGVGGGGGGGEGAEVEMTTAVAAGTAASSDVRIDIANPAAGKMTPPAEPSSQMTRSSSSADSTDGGNKDSRGGRNSSGGRSSSGSGSGLHRLNRSGSSGSRRAVSFVRKGAEDMVWKDLNAMLDGHAHAALYDNNEGWEMEQVLGSSALAAFLLLRALPSTDVASFLFWHVHVHIEVKLGQEVRYELSESGVPIVITGEQGGYNSEGLLLYVVVRDALLNPLYVDRE